MEKSVLVVRICQKLSIAMALGLSINLNAMEPAAEYIPPIAGVQPDQRPVGAPVITQINKDKEWFKQAETGLQPPFPSSLSMLFHQGNWYTPFNRPGMLGRYDIRGWHNQSSQAVWR